jgi:hypothetical protein
VFVSESLSAEPLDAVNCELLDEPYPVAASASDQALHYISYHPLYSSTVVAFAMFHNCLRAPVVLSVNPLHPVGEPFGTQDLLSKTVPFLFIFDINSSAFWGTSPYVAPVRTICLLVTLVFPSSFYYHFTLNQDYTMIQCNTHAHECPQSRHSADSAHRRVRVSLQQVGQRSVITCTKHSLQI